MDYIKILMTSICTILTYLLGGWNDTLIFLVIVMVIDYLCGVAKGIVTKTLSSNVGFIGIVRKFLMLSVIIIAVQIDRNLGYHEPIFQTAVCWFFISNECLSIFENCVALGLPVPDELKNTLEQLKNKSFKGVFKSEQK